VATTYLKFSDAEYNDLYARYVTPRKHFINISSLSPKEKDVITAQMIAELRVNVTKVRSQHSKEIASKGGAGKVLVDSTGKQKTSTKNGVMIGS
jgi:hypothetical protein